MMSQLNDSKIVITTGSNKGFGRSINEQFATYYTSEVKDPNFLHFVLIGRDIDQLLEAKKSLLLIRSELISCSVIDRCELSNKESVESTLSSINTILKDIVKSEKFKQAKSKSIYLFNNAGSLGNLKKLSSEISYEEAMEYSSINFCSFCAFCSSFNNWINLASFDGKFLVNISSLFSKVPTKSFSLYCSIKAARKMFMDVYALEQKNIRVLNYSPGPLDTEMQTIIRNKCRDGETKEMFEKLFKENKLVDTNESAIKLINILNENNFEQSQQIDYYDNK